MPPKKKPGQQPKKKFSRAAGLMPAAILVVLALIAYWNSTDAPFVFDDLETIQRNTGVRFGDYFSNFNLAGFLSTRSLLFVTFAFNHWVGEQNVTGYHILNVALHILNGLLVFFIGRNIFARVRSDETSVRMYAMLAAAFFLLHPVQTESVTYISSRSELLSTFFYLAGLLVFVLWPERRIGFVCSLAVGVIYFLGIGSKETVVTLPAAIFLYDFLFLSKAQFRPLLSRWRFYITFVAGTAGAIYVLLTRILRGTIGPGLPGHLTVWQYFLTEFRVLVIYVRLVFFPIGL